MKRLTNEVSLEKGLSEINARRLFIYICRENYPSINNSDLNVSSNTSTTDYKKALHLVNVDLNFKSCIDEVKAKLKYVTDDTKQVTPLFDKLREFREAFELRIRETPSMLTITDYQLHLKLLREEIQEYEEANDVGDIVETLDALVDTFYVLLGTVLEHGMQGIFEDAFNEVHASNMSKLENGKAVKRNDGKVLKGSKFFKPNLKQFFK